jgi:hypothetical protein
MILNAGSVGLFLFAANNLGPNKYKQVCGATVFKIRGFKVEARVFGKNSVRMGVSRVRAGVDSYRRCPSRRFIARRSDNQIRRPKEILDASYEGQ